MLSRGLERDADKVRTGAQIGEGPNGGVSEALRPLAVDFEHF